MRRRSLDGRGLHAAIPRRNCSGGFARRRFAGRFRAAVRGYAEDVAIRNDAAWCGTYRLFGAFDSSMATAATPATATAAMSAFALFRYLRRSRACRRFRCFVLFLIVSIKRRSGFD